MKELWSMADLRLDLLGILRVKKADTAILLPKFRIQFVF
jgi:hypothetical protein